MFLLSTDLTTLLYGSLKLTSKVQLNDDMAVILIEKVITSVFNFYSIFYFVFTTKRRIFGLDTMYPRRVFATSVHPRRKIPQAIVIWVRLFGSK